MGNYIFPGPTQILNDSTACTNGSEILKSLEAAFQGKLPEGSGDVKKSDLLQKEYRVATKNLLLALGNCFQNLLESFSISDTIPKNPLRPRGSLERVKFVDEGLRLFNITAGQRFFIHNEEDGTSSTDFINDDSFLHFCFSADEGTEVGDPTDLKWIQMDSTREWIEYCISHEYKIQQFHSPCQGFIAWQHASENGCWWSYWPDCYHKMMRRQAQAFGRHADTKQTQRLLMKLFRSSRAPFGTSKFGCQIRNARLLMFQALKENPQSELLEMLLGGISEDLGRPDLTPREALKHLESMASSLPRNGL